MGICFLGSGSTVLGIWSFEISLVTLLMLWMKGWPRVWLLDLSE